MKKISLFISILLLVPISVFAAEINVKTLEATSTGSTVTYSGTMEDGSYAVMCKLKDSKDEEIDLLSSEVDANKFEGSFENVADGTYTVACANYEGGEIKEAEVTVENETKEDTTSEVKTTTTKSESKTTSKSPKTGDKIMLFVSLMVVAIVGIGTSIVMIKKNNKKTI